MRNLLSFLKKTPAKPENFVALDFGTTSTKAFVYSLGEEVQLLGRGRGTPDEAVEQAVDEAGVKPTQAVVGIGGENCWCLTTTIRLNRPEPQQEVQSDEVQKLGEQIFKTSQIQAAAQMSQFTGDPELTLQMIDSKNLFHKIDGNIVPNPVGQHGRVLESSISIAYGPDTYLAQLSKNLAELDLNLWAVSSLMFILVKSLADDDPEDFNAIILDIGGKITDVAVVFGGGVWGTRPLPIGGEAFNHALSKSLAFDQPEAEEAKIAYAQRQMREEKALEVKRALQPAVDLWLSGVESALQDFEGIKTFPSRIILTGGGARLEQLREHLSNYPLMKTLPFASPPMVEVRTDVGPQNMKLIGEEIIIESSLST